MLSDGILMTSVDTGWITDERPHPTKMRLADEGFHAPLDLVDGAARVYDPIVRGELGEDLCGGLPQGLRPRRLVGRHPASRVRFRLTGERVSVRIAGDALPFSIQ